MSWDDEDDDEDFIWFSFPPSVPGEHLDYWGWKETLLGLGFTEKEFETWWDENHEIKIELDVNDQLQAIMRSNR